MERVASVPAWAPGAASAQRMSPAVVLGLQRAVGNHAVTQMLGRRTSSTSEVPGRCPCGGLLPPGQTECESCRAARVHGSGPADVATTSAPTGFRSTEVEPATSDGPIAAAVDAPEGMIQRQRHGLPAPADPAPTTAPGGPAPTDMAEMRNVKRVVDELIELMGPAATTVIPVPEHLLGSDAIAATPTPTPTPEQSVSAWPAGAPLQRSVVPETGGKAGAIHPEAGVVGSVQACYDLMTGKFEVIAWIWAGAGIKTPYGWYGAYGFIEGELFAGNFGPVMQAGACDTTCDPVKEEKRLSAHAGVGGGLFPIDIKPGNRAVFSKGGIEIGVLVTPNFGTCSLDVELIGLFDVKKYFGPAGAAAALAEQGAKKLGEQFGQRVECGAGFDLSVTAHLCRAANPNDGILGYTTDSIKLCGGGFVGCNINLSRNRALLPGGGH